MNHEFSDELLSAYLDDELSPEERADVEAALDADPELRRTCDELRALSNTLQAMPATAAPDWSATIVERALAATATDPAPTLSQRPGRNRAAWSLVAGTLAVIAAAVLIMVNLPREEQSRDVAQATADNEALTSSADAMDSAGAPAAETATATAEEAQTFNPFEAAADEAAADEAAADDAAADDAAADSAAAAPHLPADKSAAGDHPVPAATGARKPSPRGQASRPRNLNNPADEADSAAAGATLAPELRMEQKADTPLPNAALAKTAQTVKLVLRRGEDSNAELAKLLQLSPVELSQLRGVSEATQAFSASRVATASDSDDKPDAPIKEKSKTLNRTSADYEELILATLTPEQLSQADEVFVMQSIPDTLRSRLVDADQQSKISVQPFANDKVESGELKRATSPNGQRSFATPAPAAPAPAAVESEPAVPSPSAQPLGAGPRTKKYEPEAIVSDRNTPNQLRQSDSPRVFRVVPQEMLARRKAPAEQPGTTDPASNSPKQQADQSLNKSPIRIQHHPLIIIVQYEDAPAPDHSQPTEPTDE